MPEISVLQHEPVSLRDYGLNEDWVQSYLAANPAKLGLGENLTLLTRELRQTKAGRLDILLANRDTDPEQRYEVEVQLGRTDESHIIRCIEYWDIARRMWPRYEHVAVLVAEDITSRFFNVIQLFNRAIPIIAVKMVASKVNDGLVLQFVTVLHESNQSLEDEEERAAPAANREWWEKMSGKESMQLVDSLVKILAEFGTQADLNYRQSYIRPQLSSGHRLPVWLHPEKKPLRVDVELSDSESALDWKRKLEFAGLEADSNRSGVVRFKLTPDTLERGSAIVRALFKEIVTSG